MAIETGYLLCLAFGCPWRQTDGPLRSVATLLGFGVGVPDHTTFSQRSPELVLASSLAQASGPVHVVIDATGLKVYGAGEWLVEQHGARGARTWRKLHLAVDLDTGEILASELTSNGDGDASQNGPLLRQHDQHIWMIQAKGRLGWQKAVGYGRRSHAETAMFRLKAIIGSGLRTRTLPGQNTETRVACSVLN